MNGLFIGITAVDILYPLDHFPKENSKTRSAAELVDIGGPATNAAFTFSALGGRASLISQIGQNPFSAFMKEKLQQYDINHIDLNDQLQQYPIIASILVNTTNGSRTIINAKPNMEFETASLNIDLSNYDVICVDGFLNKALLKLLKKNNKKIPVVFDGGSYKKHTDVLLNYVNYPIFSENFALPDNADLADFLKKKNTDQYAITRGDKALQVFENSDSYELAVPKINAIDTLGAGDIFHGAFSKYIIETDHDFSAALSMAAKIASLSCQYIGPRKWTGSL